MTQPHIIRYSVEKFPLTQAVASILNINNLEQVHCEFKKPPDTLSRATDQGTFLHRRFYDHAASGFKLYEEFSRWILMKLIDEPVYLQRIPNIRLQFPQNIAVGEIHRDAQYGHPDGQLNLWVPLTLCEETSTIWIVSNNDHNSQLRPQILQVGEALHFDGRNILHGNVLNRTSRTRVSLDFRYIPVRKLRSSLEVSVNVKARFSPGEYYFAEPIVPVGVTAS